MGSIEGDFFGDNRQADSDEQGTTSPEKLMDRVSWIVLDNYQMSRKSTCFENFFISEKCFLQYCIDCISFVSVLVNISKLFF